MTDRKWPEGTMCWGSVTCLVCGQTADAGYLRGEGRAVRLSAIHCEAVSEIPARMPRVS